MYIFISTGTAYIDAFSSNVLYITIPVEKTCSHSLQASARNYTARHIPRAALESKQSTLRASNNCTGGNSRHLMPSYCLNFSHERSLSRCPRSLYNTTGTNGFTYRPSNLLAGNAPNDEQEQTSKLEFASAAHILFYYRNEAASFRRTSVCTHQDTIVFGSDYIITSHHHIITIPEVGSCQLG